MRIFLLIFWTILSIWGAPMVLFLAVMSTDHPRSSGLSAYIFILTGLAISLGGYWAILRITSSGKKVVMDETSSQPPATPPQEDALPQTNMPSSETLSPTPDAPSPP